MPLRPRSTLDATAPAPARSRREEEGRDTATRAENTRAENSDQPRLLSGGNPQIPKGDGPEPVAAYIAAMPGWKRELGERLDALIVAADPDVRRAVRWNQPFYGYGESGFHLAFRCYTTYVQVQFLRGASLEPEPPKASKHPEVRYLDIREDEELDEALFSAWLAQSAKLPGDHL
ncbi:DUF1801 domain-containing protein [Brachybacterium paraconglomeratum]|uniref:DUF1801 domain-containing protein n=1 Tax=Brachybacterium paraconglomeratum TaxID=173362 RepID=UPI002493B53E|nr:DUF1801 domain-containing protein [Brachybacterium paraconglomeratum]